MAAPLAARPRQLLQDRQRAQRTRVFVRIEEGVHRRQRRVADQVGDRDTEQAMAADTISVTTTTLILILVVLILLILIL